MPIKLKLNTRLSADGTPQSSTAPSGDPPVAATPASASSTSGPKLKLTFSQPPTPINGQPNTITVAPKKQRPPAIGRPASGTTKKRAANNDNISPAPKRAATGRGLTRKLSIKLPNTPRAGDDTIPVSAGGLNRIKLGLGPRRTSSAPKIRSLNVKRPPPPRNPGVGYDSEDSDAEEDPAIQQGFILRMAPGDDCDALREAIANGKIGVPVSDGGMEVSLKFLDHQFRRAVVTVRGRKYAAALVDLPCIVETMKSWDRKGWWKVADVCQMLLVLGRCNTDDEARHHELPKEVDKTTLQYAHGLTPPMHWVRRRRFRPRPSYRDMANVEEEVDRLIAEDDAVTREGGQVTSEVMDRAEAERQRSRSHFDDEDDEDEMDAEGEAIETVENEDGMYGGFNEDEDAADLEGDLQAMFDKMDADDVAPAVAAVSESPAPLADQGPSMAAVENAMAVESAAPTPMDTHDISTPDGQSPADEAVDDEESDEDDDDEDDDDDDDEDSPDVMDEDAQARAAERNQQLEEVADLEREVDHQRRKAAAMKNQLLKEKALAQLMTLEEELRTKRAVFGLDVDD